MYGWRALVERDRGQWRNLGASREGQGVVEGCKGWVESKQWRVGQRECEVGRLMKRLP